MRASKSKPSKHGRRSKTGCKRCWPVGMLRLAGQLPAPKSSSTNSKRNCSLIRRPFCTNERAANFWAGGKRAEGGQAVDIAAGNVPCCSIGDWLPFSPATSHWHSRIDQSRRHDPGIERLASPRPAVSRARSGLKNKDTPRNRDLRLRRVKVGREQTRPMECVLFHQPLKFIVRFKNTKSRTDWFEELSARELGRDFQYFRAEADRPDAVFRLARPPAINLASAYGLRTILGFVWKSAFRLGRSPSWPDETGLGIAPLISIHKGKPRGDRPRGFLHFAAEPDGQPVGGVKSAAPGYHYTMGSPPILWSHPSRLMVTTCGALGFGPSCHGRTTRMPKCIETALGKSSVIRATCPARRRYGAVGGSENYTSRRATPAPSPFRRRSRASSMKGFRR